MISNTKDEDQQVVFWEGVLYTKSRFPDDDNEQSDDDDEDEANADVHDGNNFNDDIKFDDSKFMKS